MNGISTHVLNTATGQPAPGIRAVLEVQAGNAWNRAGEGVTNEDGRIPALLPKGAPLEAGVYRLTFLVADYFAGREYFYPQITVQFQVKNTSQHYHVPLLLTRHGYTTYRGS
jgi:5-hydroxyisourate hydrolase